MPATDGNVRRRREERGDAHRDERVAPRAREAGAVCAESRSQQARADAKGDGRAPMTDRRCGRSRFPSVVLLHFFLHVEPDLPVGESGEDYPQGPEQYRLAPHGASARRADPIGRVRQRLCTRLG